MGNNESFKAGIIVNPLDDDSISHKSKSYSPTTHCNELNKKDLDYVKTTFKTCMEDDRDMGKGLVKIRN